MRVKPLGTVEVDLVGSFYVVKYTGRNCTQFADHLKKKYLAFWEHSTNGWLIDAREFSIHDLEGELKMIAIGDVQ